MTAKTFRGGIHPPERKASASAAGLFPLPPVPEVAIPVSQHLGPPNQVKVAVGDPVRRGQVISDGTAPLSVPVHASINGTVKKIEPRMLASNVEGLCVVIQATDEQYGEARLLPLKAFECSREDALARIRQAGIVGMGGASFPTHIKLNPPPGKKIDLVIANGAECEPYLFTDELLLETRGERLVYGLAAAMRICGAPKGVIAIEANKAHVIDNLKATVEKEGYEESISVQILKTKYPQGGEKMLITALTGREVPSGGLPADVGCVVQNVETLVAIANAFIDGKYLVDRPLTLSGGMVRKPVDLVAPIGASAAWIAQQVLGELPPAAKVISGGPMMGSAVCTADFPIQKNTSGLLFLDAREGHDDAEGSCIRCGRCMRACSCRLSPALLHAALVARDWELAADIGLMDCIECGTCAFVCPGRVKLVQRFKVGKLALRALKQKEAARG